MGGGRTQEVDDEAGHAHEGLLGLCRQAVSYHSCAARSSSASANGAA